MEDQLSKFPNEITIISLLTILGIIIIQSFLMTYLKIRKTYLIKKKRNIKYKLTKNTKSTKKA